MLSFDKEGTIPAPVGFLPRSIISRMGITWTPDVLVKVIMKIGYFCLFSLSSFVV